MPKALRTRLHGCCEGPTAFMGSLETHFCFINGSRSDSPSTNQLCMSSPESLTSTRTYATVHTTPLRLIAAAAAFEGTIVVLFGHSLRLLCRDANLPHGSNGCNVFPSKGCGLILAIWEDFRILMICWIDFIFRMFMLLKIAMV